jgi:hypothetical protein
MKYRKVRMALSVWWGVMAVWLCVLWMDSYRNFGTGNLSSGIPSAIFTRPIR